MKAPKKRSRPSPVAPAAPLAPPPSAPPRSRWSPIARLGVCLVLAVVATWPLAGSLATALPLGTEQEATVPLLNLWSLWWNADRLAHGFDGYWTAPIFHPLTGTFAFSEPQVLQGVALAPLWWLGAPPSVIYNLALLLTLAANGLAAAALARRLGAGREGELFAAAAAITLPYAAKVLGVLPVLPLFGLFWALAGLVRFGETGGWRPAFAAVAGFAAQFLAAQQMALLALPFVLAAGLVALFEQRFRWRAIVALAGAGALGALALLPMVLPVARIHERYGFARSDEVVEALSARPADFASRPATARLSVPAREDPTAGDTAGLFPGALLLALALAGALVVWRARERRTWIAYFAGAIALAVFFALGLHLQIGGFRPFAALRDIVPGLRTLRSPFRAAAVGQAFLVPLAALALSRLAAWRPAGRAIGPALAVAIGLLAAGENLARPGRLAPTPRSARTETAEWLRARAGRPVVVHVPLPEGLHVADYERDAWRMFHQTWHGRPMLNGYSGFFPSGFGMFQADVDENFPSERLLCMMTLNLGVDTVVVDRPWYELRREIFAPFEQSGFLAPAHADEQELIFRAAPPAGACLAPPGS